jgi:hypothetical protein
MGAHFKESLNIKSSQQGFSLPVGMTIGVIMLGGAIIAITSATKNKLNIIAEERSKQSMAIAEGGVANILLSLSKNAPLLNKSKSEWTNSNIISSTPVPNDCNFRSTLLEQFNNLKVDGEINSGTYTFVDYNFNSSANVGSLIVDGFLNDNFQSQSRIQVDFLVDNLQSSSGSGLASLMANKMELKQLDVKASKLVCTNPNNCPVVCSVLEKTPTLSTLMDAIGLEKNGNINDAEINVGGAIIPPIPDNFANHTNLGNITKGLTLPRSQDTSNYIQEGSKRTYFYQVGNINKGSLLFVDNPNYQYKVFVSGNIDISGNDGIGLVPTKKGPVEPQPLQVQLIGNNNSTTPTNWNFGGTFCNTAFIHAPNTTITFNGGGNGCAEMRDEFKPNNSPNFFGVVWANEILAGDSNSVSFYEQEGVINLLDANSSNVSINSIGNITGWQRLSK